MSFVRSAIVLALLATALPARAGEAENKALAKATAAAGELGKTLKEKLTTKVSEVGPAKAATFCAEEAPKLTAAVRERTGVAVGRASTRLRNTKNAPPTWLEAWLKENEGKPAAAIAPISRIDTEAGRSVARFAKPIAIDAPCLLCHGRDEVQPAVAAELTRLYPGDHARGYALGDLRGVVWAEVPVEGAK